MKICILGCGYVGQAAAIHWRKLGHTITVTTRNPEKVSKLKTLADRVVLIKGSLESCLEEQEVLLFSAAPDSMQDYKHTYLDNARAIQTLVPSNASLTQILYTSSTSLYGDHQGNWVDEKTPPNISNIFSEILIETEKTLMECFTAQRNVAIFRLGEIYGPGREIINRLRSSQGVAFPGTGESYTNLSHLQIIVDGLTFALEKRLSGIYNLVEDLHIPRKQFYEVLCKENGLTSILWDPSLPSRHGGNKKVSNDKIKAFGLRLPSVN